jgi:ribosomal protein S18 acetylase RimI-like enzyme
MTNPIFIQVRDSQPGDMADVKTLQDLAFRPLRKIYRPTSAACAKLAGIKPQLRRLVAILDGKPVGSVQYYAVDDRLHLLGLAVHPDFQRRGIAKRLLESLSHIATSMKLRKLSLYTVKQTGNGAIFEKMGFQAITEEPDSFSESDTFERLTDIYMERPIG